LYGVADMRLLIVVSPSAPTSKVPDETVQLLEQRRENFCPFPDQHQTLREGVNILDVIVRNRDLHSDRSQKHRTIRAVS
jgi:hypothetical protein